MRILPRARAAATSKKKTMSDRDKSIAEGHVGAGQGREDLHRLPQQRERHRLGPGQEGFDFEEAKKEEIAHPIPEDVKGKYLEVEKKLKAERKARGESVDEDEEDEE